MGGVLRTGTESLGGTREEIVSPGVPPSISWS